MENYIWSSKYDMNLFHRPNDCLNDPYAPKIIYLVCLISVTSNEIIFSSNLILLFLFYFHTCMLISFECTGKNEKSNDKSICIKQSGIDHILSTPLLKFIFLAHIFIDTSKCNGWYNRILNFKLFFCHGKIWSVCARVNQN